MYELGWALCCAGSEQLDAIALALASKAARGPVLARRIKSSVQLELGPPAISWEQSLEVERGAQMWSMGRKGDEAWSVNSKQPGSPS